MPVFDLAERNYRDKQARHIVGLRVGLPSSIDADDNSRALSTRCVIPVSQDVGIEEVVRHGLLLCAQCCGAEYVKHILRLSGLKAICGSVRRGLLEPIGDNYMERQPGLKPGRVVATEVAANTFAVDSGEKI